MPCEAFSLSNVCASARKQARAILLRAIRCQLGPVLVFDSVEINRQISLDPGTSHSDGHYRHNRWLRFISKWRHWLMAHCCDGHPSDIIDAVDNIGTPDIVSKREDFTPHIAECVVPRLEVASIRVRIEFGIDRLAILHLNDRNRAIGPN